MDQGLDGEEDASADLNQLDEAFVKLDASVAATQAPAASAHGDDREGAEDEEFSIRTRVSSPRGAACLHGA